MLGAAILLIAERLGKDDAETLNKQLKDSFAALSREALFWNTEEFLKLAGEKLSGRADLVRKNWRVRRR